MSEELGCERTTSRSPKPCSVLTRSTSEREAPHSRVHDHARRNGLSMAASPATFRADPSFKYPDRQSLPGSAQRNVPVLVEAILPLLLPLLREHTGEGEREGEQDSQHQSVERETSSPVRVLELAAGHGGLTLALRKAVLAQQQQEGTAEEHRRGVPNQQPRQVQWTCTEADDALVQSIRSNIAQQQGEAGPKEDKIAVARLEIDDESDWSALAPAETKSSAAPGSGSVSPSTQATFDLVLIANLLHIVPFETVRSLFSHLPRVLSVRSEAKVCIYGAFNEEGKFTSEGNEKVSTAARPLLFRCTAFQ